MELAKNSFKNNLAFANECAIATGISMDEFQEDNSEWRERKKASRRSKFLESSIAWEPSCSQLFGGCMSNKVIKE